MSPSEATNRATRKEWRNLGFYYAIDKSRRAWRFVGSKTGLGKIATLLREYSENPRNDSISEHAHYGPYMYFTILTAAHPVIDRAGIHGSLSDLARLADLIEKALTSATVGDALEIGRDYASSTEYRLIFEVQRELFDPAEADPLLR